MPTFEKILCLGANTEDTDQKATIVAHDHGMVNHGLISRSDFIPESPGVYHTSVADISSGAIINLAKKFDITIMLDQSRESWPHWKNLLSTYKIMIDLESQGYLTEFSNNNNVREILKIDRMIKENPSWCIYPWINLMVRDGTGTRLCARSETYLTKELSIDAWQNSGIRKELQEKMLRGERMPEHCSMCYRYEDLGIESYRQYESRDWLHQLGISEYHQLSSISQPKYYEIHWSNRCNIKCRGCVPSRSSAISEEFQRHHVIMPFADDPIDAYPGVDIVDISSLDHVSRVYITGGEPTIMPETIEFMRRCVEQNRTNFELTMSINGVKIPEEFAEISRHFSNLNLSFSLDGYGPINDYWRSGSRWDRIVANMHRMQEFGHNITINTVPGIYNVTNLHRLFEWLDQEFPQVVIYLQINHNRIQNAYNHPDAPAVIESMRRCQETQVYWSNGKSCRTGIDSIYDYYSKNPKCNLEDLQGFFEYNDRLDEIRGMYLRDYIPELEAGRSLIK